MLIIRREQVAVLVQAAADRFVRETADHIRARWPRSFARLGEEDVQSAIQHGIERARSYRIQTEASVRLFIEMMFLLGPAFDTDPKLPWASQCLLAPGDERMRVSALIAAARVHLQELDARNARGTGNG